MKDLYLGCSCIEGQYEYSIGILRTLTRDSRDTPWQLKLMSDEDASPYLQLRCGIVEGDFG